jgi:CRP/FNR family transcriptional regulator, cyclic AMP receptor protein
MEDPLAYLPCSSVQEYSKGNVIYHHDQPNSNLFLVLAGRVRITRDSGRGTQVLVDLYGVDEFFGEASFVANPDHSEQATAHQDCKLMTWKASEILELILKRPVLAVALLQTFEKRAIALTERLESLSTERIDRRVARTLIHFAEQFGKPREDGGLEMEPLTHELLAQYVGTSRELVTLQMTNLRRQGYLQYSRRSIVLYRDALREWIRQNGYAAAGRENGSVMSS